MAKMNVCAGDVEFEATDGSFTSSIDDLARADLVAQLGDVSPDWWGLLEARFNDHLGFSGSVLTAQPGADGVRLTAASGVEMTEVLMDIVSAEDFPVQDIVYASALAAGFTRDRMQIHGLDELPREPIEVVVPLRGVASGDHQQVGPLSILDPVAGARALERFRAIPDEVADAWQSADSFGVVVCEARTLADAEIQGREAVDTVLSWLAVRVRYGHARLPDGTLARFNRDMGRTLPRREGAMAVRGLLTARRWLRDPESLIRRETLRLDEGDFLWPPLQPRIATADRLALLAARKVAASTDPVERAAALSEAFEFYVGKASPEPAFTPDALDRLKRELPGWLTKEQARRAREVLGMANQASWGQRLRLALQNDGVPVTRSEWKAIMRVRKIRNRAVHGSEALASEADDIELVTSILARALVYRAALSNDSRLVE